MSDVDVSEIIDVPKYEQPQGVSRKETPAGVEIYFQNEPKRLYKLDGVWAPSVSEVLDILDNPSLPWWGMKVGMVGILELYKRGEISEMTIEQSLGGDFGGYEALCLSSGRSLRDVTLDDLRDPDHPLLELVKQQKLTTNDYRDAGGARGTSVHNALENWCKTGHLPAVDDYPPEEQGYITGLLGFLAAIDLEPIHTELMVGSVRHKFAGRFDLFARTREQTLDRGYRRRKRHIPEGKGIWDLKTSRGIFKKNHLQTAGYRIGLEELYYERSDYEAILNVQADGSWDVQLSKKTPHDFLAIRQAYEAVK